MGRTLLLLHATSNFLVSLKCSQEKQLHRLVKCLVKERLARLVSMLDYLFLLVAEEEVDSQLLVLVVTDFLDLLDPEGLLHPLQE